MFDAAVWGTVGQWVSGLASSGALTLGFYLMLRDRRKAEQSQAQMIACWIDPTPHPDKGSGREFDVRLVVRNNSDNDIYRATFTLFMGHSTGKEKVYAGYFANRIPPKTGFGWQLIPLRPQEDYDVLVVFADASGREWIRNMTTLRLRRVGHIAKPITREGEPDDDEQFQSLQPRALNDEDYPNE